MSKDDSSIKEKLGKLGNHVRMHAVRLKNTSVSQEKKEYEEIAETIKNTLKQEDEQKMLEAYEEYAPKYIKGAMSLKTRANQQDKYENKGLNWNEYNQYELAEEMKIFKEHMEQKNQKQENLEPSISEVSNSSTEPSPKVPAEEREENLLVMRRNLKGWAEEGWQVNDIIKDIERDLVKDTGTSHGEYFKRFNEKISEYYPNGNKEASETWSARQKGARQEFTENPEAKKNDLREILIAQLTNLPNYSAYQNEIENITDIKDLRQRVNDILINPDREPERTTSRDLAEDMVSSAPSTSTQIKQQQKESENSEKEAPFVGPSSNQNYGKLPSELSQSVSQSAQVAQGGIEEDLQQIIAAKKTLIGQSIINQHKQNDQDKGEEFLKKTKEPGWLDEYLKTEAGFKDVQTLLQNKEFKQEMEKLELQSSKILLSPKNNFKALDWSEQKDGIRTKEIKNERGEKIAELKETNHKLEKPIQVDGKEIRNYRTVDFPKELGEKSGPMHIALALKDADGNNIAADKALYFTAHYDKEGKLKEVNAPQPIKFSNKGDDAIGYIEKDGQVYTVPVNQGQYKEMMQEVAKNKGMSFDISLPPESKSANVDVPDLRKSDPMVEKESAERFSTLSSVEIPNLKRSATKLRSPSLTEEQKILSEMVIPKVDISSLNPTGKSYETQSKEQNYGRYPEELKANYGNIPSENAEQVNTVTVNTSENVSLNKRDNFSNSKETNYAEMPDVTALPPLDKLPNFDPSTVPSPEPLNKNLTEEEMAKLLADVEVNVELQTNRVDVGGKKPEQPNATSQSLQQDEDQKGGGQYNSSATPYVISTDNFEPAKTVNTANESTGVEDIPPPPPPPPSNETEPVASASAENTGGTLAQQIKEVKLKKSVDAENNYSNGNKLVSSIHEANTLEKHIDKLMAKRRAAINPSSSFKLDPDSAAAWDMVESVEVSAPPPNPKDVFEGVDMANSKKVQEKFVQLLKDGDEEQVKEAVKAISEANKGNKLEFEGGSATWYIQAMKDALTTSKTEGKEGNTLKNITLLGPSEGENKGLGVVSKEQLKSGLNTESVRTTRSPSVGKQNNGIGIP